MKKIITLAAMLAIHVASYAQITYEDQPTGIIDTTVVNADTVANTSFVNMQAKRDFLRKVYDNAVYMQNISARIDLGISGLGHDITLDGKIQMRRNQVIRITITPFGLMEVARLEFTPTYVLLIDRIHKEYVKASYNDVAFLKSEGMTFYTLQSLFWNELFQPGKEKLSDGDLSLFDVKNNNDGADKITLVADKMTYEWTTDNKALIKAANITYCKGTAQQSNVNVAYDNFVPLGVKLFPSRENITFNSKAFSTGSMSLNINMGTISTDANWEPRTSVSDRYKQVTAEDFLSRLGKL